MESSSYESRLDRRERAGHLLGVLGGLAIAAVVVAGLVVATWGGGSARAGSEIAPPADPFELDGYEFAGALGGSTLPNIPSDIAIGTDGTTYVADAGANRVLAFDQNGELVEGWGPDGSGVSTVMHGPTGLALDDGGNLYVLSSRRARIEKLDSSGQAIDSWSVQQGPVDSPTIPVGIAADSAGNIYVAGDGIKVFAPNGGLERSWHVAETRYRDIAINSQDRVYATTDSELRVFEANGKSIASWPRQRYVGSGRANNNLTSLTIDDRDNIYVVNFGSGSDEQTGAIKLNSGGERLAEWTVDIRFTPRTVARPFPGSPGVDRDGNLYIPDSSRQRVVKMNQDGEIIDNIGGDNRKTFAGLGSITADQDGALYAVDPIRERILVFGPDGQVTHSFDMQREGVLPFIPPETPDITVGPDGFIYAADPSDSSILRYTPEGQLVAQWGGIGFNEGELIFPHAIAVDAEQRLFIIDDNVTVKLYSVDGEYIGVLSESLRPMAQQLANIALVDDRIYVPVDNDAGAAVEVYDLEGNLIRTAVRFAIGSENAKGLEGIPNSIAADEAGNVYLPITVPSDSSGNLWISRFVIVGPENEAVANAEIGPRYGLHSTAVGPDGAVYVTDPLTKHILVYEPVG